MRIPYAFYCSVLPPEVWPQLGDLERLQAQAAWAWREGQDLNLPPPRILEFFSPFASAFAIAAMEALPSEGEPGREIRRWKTIWLADLPEDHGEILGILARVEREGSWGASFRRIPKRILEAITGQILSSPSGLLIAEGGVGYGHTDRTTRMRVMWRRSGGSLRLLAEAWRGRIHPLTPTHPAWGSLGFPEVLRTALLAPDRAVRLGRLAARGRALAAAVWGPEVATWLPDGLIVLPRPEGRGQAWVWEPGSGLRSGGTIW